LLFQLLAALMLKQFNVQSETCWIRCLTTTRISYSTLTIYTNVLEQQVEQDVPNCIRHPKQAEYNLILWTCMNLSKVRYWTRWDDCLLIKGLLQEICSKPKSWMRSKMTSNSIKDLLESYLIGLFFKIKFVLKTNFLSWCNSNTRQIWRAATSINRRLDQQI
jgi:hypothetical protein